MSIAKDMRKFAATPRDKGGRPPDQDPVFAKLLAEEWAKEFVDDDEKPMAAEGARIRHSDAGACARRLGYKLLGAEASNPLTVADHWRFGVGNLVHEGWQRALQAAYPGAEVEFTVTLGDGLTAGHGDALVRIQEPADPAGNVEERLIAFELKTINGFGFKKAIGARGAPEGPRHNSKLQGALNALGKDADYLVIVYTSLELLSPREATKLGPEDWRRFCAQWTYPRERYAPAAQRELERLALIVADVDAGVMPERAIPDPELPDGAVIFDPVKGRWEVREGGLIKDTGTTWHCAYCPFQDQCTRDAEAGQ